MHPVPFYGQDYKKQKGSGTIYKSFFGWKNIIGENPFLMIYHEGNFDDLSFSSFWVIPKITIAKLCKLVHIVIIISVSSDPMNLETVKSKEKITKKTISWEPKELAKWKNFS